jgi:hypothetical protein
LKKSKVLNLLLQHLQLRISFYEDFNCSIFYRHRHALKRVRGEGGKFNSNDLKRGESGEMSDGYDDNNHDQKNNILVAAHQVGIIASKLINSRSRLI